MEVMKLKYSLFSFVLVSLKTRRAAQKFCVVIFRLFCFGGKSCCIAQVGLKLNIVTGVLCHVLDPIHFM